MRQSHLGERAKLLEAQYHPEDVEVDAAGIWDDGHANYHGGLSICLVLPALKGVGIDGEKSADAILVGLIGRWRTEPVRASMMDILIVLGRSPERGPDKPVK